MLNRLQKAAQNKDDASSGFFDSSNSSNASPKSNSPTNSLHFNDEPIITNASKKIRPLLMNKMTTKSNKIESAL